MDNKLISNTEQSSQPNVDVPVLHAKSANKPTKGVFVGLFGWVSFVRTEDHISS
jgi:hypothetical protein